MERARPGLQWRWLVVAAGLAIPWMFIWDNVPSIGLFYVSDAAASVGAAFGVFWVYRRVTDAVLNRNDVGRALKRVATTSVLVVLASFILVQATYTLKIDGSPGPQEVQAMTTGAFVISAAGIYRILDSGSHPERAEEHV